MAHLQATAARTAWRNGAPLASRYGLQIRAATPADAAGLAALMEAAGRPVPPSVLEGRLEALRGAPGSVLLAAEWGPPGGVVALSWHRTLNADAPLAEIDSLLVAPADRRRGIGRLLLKAGAQAARAAGCGALVCRVPDSDDSLRDFCVATGFGAAGGVYTRPLRKGAEAAG